MHPVPVLDALKLIPMIAQAANRACMHKKNCRQFAQHLERIDNQLKEITICQQARKPLEQLEQALRKSYRLVTRCQNRNFFYVLCMGWNIENQFRELEKEIDQILKIVPLIHLADNARVMEKERAKKAAAEERRRAERKRAERAAAERAKKAAAEEKERAKRAAAEKRERDKRAAAERAKKAAAEEKERAKRAAAEKRERDKRAAAEERARAAKGRPEKTTAKKK